MHGIKYCSYTIIVSIGHSTCNLKVLLAWPKLNTQHTGDRSLGKSKVMYAGSVTIPGSTGIIHNSTHLAKNRLDANLMKIVNTNFNFSSFILWVLALTWTVTHA